MLPTEIHTTAKKDSILLTFSDEELDDCTFVHNLVVGFNINGNVIGVELYDNQKDAIEFVKKFKFDKRKRGSMV